MHRNSDELLGLLVTLVDGNADLRSGFDGHRSTAVLETNAQVDRDLPEVERTELEGADARELDTCFLQERELHPQIEVVVEL